MKKLLLLVSLVLLVPPILSAAVPLKWTVESSRVQPTVFEAYQGETIAFEATLNSYGKPLEAPSEYSFFWQTPEMGTDYWSVACTPTPGASTNLLEAVWLPEYDNGSKLYNCFIGQPGTIYHAAFQLRLRPSPGAVPSALPLPVKTLDFAKVVVTNAPYYTQSEIDGALATKANATHSHAQSDITGLASSLNNKANLSGGNIFYNDQWIANGDLNLVAAGFYVDRSGIGQEYIDGRWNGDYWAFMGTKRFLILNGLDFSSAMGAQAPTINGSPIATIANLATKQDTLTAGDNITITNNVISSTATPSDYDTVSSAAISALSYSQGIYRYMLGNTNAWFEGTNYVVNSSNSTKIKYTHETWEDVNLTPPSLQLYEVRDGATQVVWDQRDWTKYWVDAKSSQLSNNFDTVISELDTNKMSRGWAKYTAVQGLDNPADDTLWVDTAKIQIAAGMQWQKMVELNGMAYWTLTGNGITIEPEIVEENAFLSFKDFEGNAVLTMRKTSAQLLTCECGSDITNSYLDSQGRVTFHFTTNVQPIGEFTTDLSEQFIAEDDSDCPATVVWTEGANGGYDCHFTATDPTETACFARFKVLKEGENVVEYHIPVKIDDGIVFSQNGTDYKIKPTVTNGNVTWSVVQ